MTTPPTNRVRDNVIPFRRRLGMRHIREVTKDVIADILRRQAAREEAAKRDRPAE